MRISPEQLETYLVGFVSEEVYFVKAFVFDPAKSICLVPAIREYIEGNLAADGVSQAIFRELLLEGFNKFGPVSVLL